MTRSTLSLTSGSAVDQVEQGECDATSSRSADPVDLHVLPLEYPLRRDFRRRKAGPSKAQLRTRARLAGKPPPHHRSCRIFWGDAEIPRTVVPAYHRQVETAEGSGTDRTARQHLAQPVLVGCSRRALRAPRAYVPQAAYRNLRLGSV